MGNIIRRAVHHLAGNRNHCRLERGTNFLGFNMKFTPEDFKMAAYAQRFVDTQEPFDGAFAAIDREAARQANARLAEMLAEAPEVYGRIGEDGHFYVPDPRLGLKSGMLGSPDTHKARLVCIEEIEK